MDVAARPIAAVAVAIPVVTILAGAGIVFVASMIGAVKIHGRCA